MANTYFKTQEEAHSKTGSMVGIFGGVRVYTQVTTTLYRQCIEIVAALSRIVTAFCIVLDKVKATRRKNVSEASPGRGNQEILDLGLFVPW